MINSSHLPAFVFPIKLRGRRSGLLRRTSKPAISHICHIIIYGNPVLNEDSLHKACICLQFYHFILIGIICQLGKNMAFIVRIKIIAVNNPHRIIQLQTEFESQILPTPKYRKTDRVLQDNNLYPAEHRRSNVVYTFFLHFSIRHIARN